MRRVVCTFTKTLRALPCSVQGMARNKSQVAIAASIELRDLPNVLYMVLKFSRLCFKGKNEVLARENVRDIREVGL